MNNFAVAMIQQDFDADVWSTAGEITLLGALRRDVWLLLPAGTQGQVTSMSEIYVPRYLLAETASRLEESLDHARPGPGEVSAWMRVWAHVSLRITSNGVWELAINGLAFTLPEAVAAAIKHDVELWREAARSIDQDGERYVLPGDTTHAGHPIDFSSRRPIQAIAFEKRIRGELDATDFGIYSAFCTMRDFPSSRRLSDTICEEALDLQFSYFDPETIPDDVLAAIAVTQRELLGRELWGPGITERSIGDTQTLSCALLRLAPVQHTQFVLLSGMYNCGLLVVLATILGHLSFERYGALKCEGLQADSEEEQETRTHLAYIQMLGELMGDAPVPDFW